MEIGRVHIMKPKGFCVIVRQYAEEHELTEDEALQEGMQSKAVEFVEKGAEVYQKA